MQRYRRRGTYIQTYRPKVKRHAYRGIDVERRTYRHIDRKWRDMHTEV